MRSSLLLAVLAASPLIACRAQAPQSSVSDLAAAWCGGQTSPTCYTRGEPSILNWERPTTGASDADRLIDSLSTAFARQGLALRQCGEGDVPAGRDRAMVWEGPDLLVHLSRIAPAEGPPKLYVVAMDEPAAFPTSVCPAQPQRGAAPATGGRVMVGDGLGVLMRPDALEDITRYEFAADSIVTVIRYRVDSPMADSVSARRTITQALADTRGFQFGKPDGSPDPLSARLVVRPCYQDHCPQIPRESGGALQPGDFVFAPTPDGSWVPAAAAPQRR